MENFKFRVWDKKNEVMMPVCTWEMAAVGFISTGSYNDRHGNEKCGGIVQEFVINQYVGFIDKNDKEIFEEDILKVQCELYSGSHSLWYRKTNKRHFNQYFVYLRVKWDQKETRFILEPIEITKRQIEEIIKPHGEEKIKQHLHVPRTFIDRGKIEGNKCNHVEVIGNIFEGFFYDTM